MQPSDEIKMGFKHATSAMLIKLLTDTYQQPLAAALRETVSNAFDACDKAKTPRDTVRVHIPNDAVNDADRAAASFFPEGECKSGCASIARAGFAFVSDRGCGMDEKTLIESFLTYANSTKTGSDGMIGSFGLGAKSPLAYADRMHVWTKAQGGDTLYASVMRSRDGGAFFTDPKRIQKMSSPVEGDHGTVIAFPMQSGSMHYDKGRARDTVRFMSFVSGIELLDEDKCENGDAPGERLRASGEHFASIGSVQVGDDSCEVRACDAGGLAVLLREAKDGRRMDASRVAFRIGGWLYPADGTACHTSGIWSHSLGFGIVIDAPARLLGFVPSRDTIVAGACAVGDLLEAAQSLLASSASSPRRMSEIAFAVHSMQWKASRAKEHGHATALPLFDGASTCDTPALGLADGEIVVSPVASSSGSGAEEGVRLEDGLHFSTRDLEIDGRAVADVLADPPAAAFRLTQSANGGYEVRGGALRVSNVAATLCRHRAGFDAVADGKGHAKESAKQEWDASKTTADKDPADGWFSPYRATIVPAGVAVEAVAAQPFYNTRGSRFNDRKAFLVADASTIGIARARKALDRVLDERELADKLIGCIDAVVLAKSGGKASTRRFDAIVEQMRSAAPGAEVFTASAEEIERAEAASGASSADAVRIADAMKMLGVCEVAAKEEARDGGDRVSRDLWHLLYDAQNDCGNVASAGVKQINDAVGDKGSGWTIWTDVLNKDRGHLETRMRSVKDKKHVAIVLLDPAESGSGRFAAKRALAVGAALTALELLGSDIDTIIGASGAYATQKRADVLSELGCVVAYDGTGKVDAVVGKEAFDTSIADIESDDARRLIRNCVLNGETKPKCLLERVPESIDEALRAAAESEMRHAIEELPSKLDYSLGRSLGERMRSRTPKCDEALVRFASAMTAGCADAELSGLLHEKYSTDDLDLEDLEQVALASGVRFEKASEKHAIPARRIASACDASAKVWNEVMRDLSLSFDMEGDERTARYGYVKPDVALIYLERVSVCFGLPEKASQAYRTAYDAYGCSR